MNEIVVWGFKLIIALGILVFMGGVANFSSECENLRGWFKLVVSCFIVGLGFILISLGAIIFYLMLIYVWG